MEQENDPKRTHEEVQAMIKKRTVDRYLLVGTHDVTTDGVEQQGGLVGEEIYFSEDDIDGSSRLRSWSAMYLSFLVVNIFLNIFLVRFNI